MEHIENSLVIKAKAVAEMLGWTTENSFRAHRAELEKNGFPAKLPGIDGWSRPAVERWIATNGATHLPADLVEIGEDAA